jgi:MFS family permease
LRTLATIQVRERRKMEHGTSKLSRAVSFWLIAILLGLFLFAASAPSPLYAIYAARFHFSPSTITAIYSVYAFGALFALLITGRLSDHLGRRSVMAVGLVVQLSGMIAFIVAQGAGALYAARTLQGVGTGIAVGAGTAWLLDLQPSENPRFGSLVGGIALLAGLALGALGSGLLVEYGPDPLHLVFWLLLGVYVAALMAMFVLPDPVGRTPGWLASMRPDIGVPPRARSLFASLVPSFAATWAVAGLYLALGPSLSFLLIQTDNRVTGGLVIVALLGSGAVASALTRAWDPRSLVIRGSLALIAGVGITLIALAIDWTAGLYVGSVIAGLGFGPAFSGVFRSLAAKAAPERRGALLASVYIVLYLSFSLPTILAGIAVTHFGLRNTTYVYGVLAMALAATTAVMLSRQSLARQNG